MGKAKKNKQDLSKVRVLRGKKLQYIGVAGKIFKCTSCPKTFKRGMISEFGGKYYCSEGCIPK